MENLIFHFLLFFKEADLNLIPPGPDYLILSVKYKKDNYTR